MLRIIFILYLNSCMAAVLTVHTIAAWWWCEQGDIYARAYKLN